MEPIVVTGATGTVGNAVLAELRRSGVPVRALTRTGRMTITGCPGKADQEVGAPPDGTGRGGGGGDDDDGNVEVVRFSFTDPTTWGPRSPAPQRCS